MNKENVYPHVVIYKGFLEDTAKIVDVLKKSKSIDSDNESQHVLRRWKNWPPMGEMMIVSPSYGESVPENESAKEELDILNAINEKYKFVLLDYIKDWKDSEIWKPYITSWDIDKPKWQKSGVSFLRYNPTVNPSHLAMAYHTDTHEFAADNRGSKFVITVTMYLNDDYEGGEISFLDEKNKKVVTYKPKAGDITVFPSCEPFYHGVYPIVNNERYLLRMFLLWDYEGSEEWLNNEAKHGHEEWSKMEYDRTELEFNSGNWHRHVVYDQENYDPKTNKAKVVFVEKETRIS